METYNRRKEHIQARKKVNALCHMDQRKERSIIPTLVSARKMLTVNVMKRNSTKTEIKKNISVKHQEHHKMSVSSNKKKTSQNTIIGHQKHHQQQ